MTSRVAEIRTSELDAVEVELLMPAISHRDHVALVAGGNYRSVGNLMRSLNFRGAVMECLDKNSSTWLWEIDAVDISLPLGIRKVVLCSIFFCTILTSMTKVK
jgi:hypothetical protein